MTAQITGDRSGGRGRKLKSATQSHPILMPLHELRPTQVAVGMQAVKCQRRKLEKRAGQQRRLNDILERRSIPAVLGPGGDLYMIDRHHFALALWQSAIEHAFAHIIDDLSDLQPSMFWRRMESSGRLFPFDETGRRVPPRCLPRSLDALRHDPFRDLAWHVREAGGFEKSPLPFAEFRWAMFFRKKITPSCASVTPEAAFKRAMKLSRSKAAAHLPGYLG